MWWHKIRSGCQQSTTNIMVPENLRNRAAITEWHITKSGIQWINTHLKSNTCVYILLFYITCSIVSSSSLLSSSICFFLLSKALILLSNCITLPSFMSISVSRFWKWPHIKVLLLMFNFTYSNSLLVQLLLKNTNELKWAIKGSSVNQESWRCQKRKVIIKPPVVRSGSLTAGCCFWTPSAGPLWFQSFLWSAGLSPCSASDSAAPPDTLWLSEPVWAAADASCPELWCTWERHRLKKFPLKWQILNDTCR